VVAALPPADLAPLLPGDGRGFLAPGGEIPWSPIVCLHFLFEREVLPLPLVFAVGEPLQAAFSVTRLQGREGPEHVAVVQSGARDWVGRPLEEVKEEILASLARVAPRVGSARLLAAYVLRFPRATFLPGPGVDGSRPGPLTPIRGLFLAGDFVDTGWPATLEGAIRSGLSAADAALNPSLGVDRQSQQR